LYPPPTPARPRFEVAATIRLIFHLSAFFKAARQLSSTANSLIDTNLSAPTSGFRPQVSVLPTSFVSQTLFAIKAPAVKYSATRRSQTS
jgi:hypothetical protein